MVRRQTRTVTVGDVKIGSQHPIVVQSMTCTDTDDAAATSAQDNELGEAGGARGRVYPDTHTAT
ncbi:MAG: flavodoxin-dependent (E)-4-hydroxy-3-methylbut-2-enyl-diphosphate synthase, partial [Planctomycetes bacterium]|nr:flavodoxin-dependent (E)-4-hydroxy-3-methylbut-2-enyl-diphosphate synthase [Planctomycetota bacterium]